MRRPKGRSFRPSVAAAGPWLVVGDRVGVEYQSVWKAGSLGSLVYGAKAERETANTFAINLSPVPGSRRSTLAASQDTRSVFALWQLPVGERLDFTAGGRIDDIAGVARAETSGVETSADAEMLSGYLRSRPAYTNLRAKDLSTNLTLARRPEHVGTIALAVTPMPGWLIEPRLLLVSDRFNSANENGRLPAYARVDLYTEYRIDAIWKTYPRDENILDARYQEALNYGTTGPALHAGLSGTW